MNLLNTHKWGFILLFLFSLSAHAYTPKATKVIENVYAIVGPLGQRSAENDGLNNNLGFIVTENGVILIDSGASFLGAQKVHNSIKEITSKPVKWVINTGSQDHRWLGNDYFAQQGAEIIALSETINTQKKYADQHMEKLKRFLGDRLEKTVPLPATTALQVNPVELNLGNQKLILKYNNAHFNGDTWIWLPEQKIIFTGDLVYVDRMLSVLPWSSVRNANIAFTEMIDLKPVYIIPGHGRVCDLDAAKKDTGDYYKFLNEVIGGAAMEMEPIEEIVDKYTNMTQFKHLKHYDDLHRSNINRAFIELESF